MTSKWRCGDCRHETNVDLVLKAPSPFEEGAVIWGCPECKSVDDFQLMCDVENCHADAVCGWPSPEGYRNTCDKHGNFTQSKDEHTTNNNGD